MGGRPLQSSMAYGSAGAGGLLFLGPLLMILFRQKSRAGGLDYAYPDAATDLNRWLPLVKWFLALPHYIVLFSWTSGRSSQSS